MRGRGESAISRSRIAAAVSLLLVLAIAACAEGPTDEDPETSDQLISTSPSTVAPTPANVSPDEGSLVAWCGELEAASDDRVEEVYRQGTQLDNRIVARAAAIAVSGDASEREILEAGDRIERACSDA
jgi:hypothetical protein